MINEVGEGFGGQSRPILIERTLIGEGLANERRAFLQLLTGKDRPIRKINIIKVGDQKYCQLPATDEILVWDSKENQLIQKNNADLADSDQPILPISLASLFNDLRFVQATQSVFDQVQEQFGKAVKTIRDNRGKLLAVIVPAHPGKLAKPLDDQGKKWGLVSLLEEKGLEAELVLLAPDFDPKQLPELVDNLEQQLDSKGEGERLEAGIRETLYLKLRVTNELLRQHQNILEQVEKSGARAFDPEYYPGEEVLKQAIIMVRQLQKTTEGLSQNLLPSLSEEQRKAVEKIMASGEHQKQISSLSQDLANRLYRLGITQAAIRDLFSGILSDQELDQAFSSIRRRVRREKTRAVWIRYSHFILNCINQGLWRIEIQINHQAPEVRLLSLLAQKAGRMLIEKLDLPQEPRIRRLFSKVLQSAGKEMPKSVEQWLEKQRFRERLQRKRAALAVIQAKEKNLTPEQKIQLAQARYDWQKFVAQQLLAREIRVGRTGYPLYPIKTKKELRDLFAQWQKRWQSEKRVRNALNRGVVDQLWQEQLARWQLAQEEQKTIEAILDLQSPFYGFGYPGWKSEDSSSWKQNYTFLESTPSRIVVDRDINCVGRAGLVLAIMTRLGLHPFGATTYDHIFLVFEDSFGVARVVEPSGPRQNSYYLMSTRLFGLSRQLTNKEIIQETITIDNQRERVAITCSATTNWLAGVVKNFTTKTTTEEQNLLAKLLTKINPLDESYWSLRGLSSRDPSEEFFCYLQSAAINSWYDLPIAMIDTFTIRPPEIMAIRLTRKLNPEQLRILKKNLDSVITAISSEEIRQELNRRRAHHEKEFNQEQLRQIAAYLKTIKRELEKQQARQTTLTTKMGY